MEKKKLQDEKKQNHVPQDTMVISPGVQPRKKKEEKKGITRVQQEVSKYNNKSYLQKVWSCIYSNKDPLNRLDEIMKLIILLLQFTLSVRAGLPYNSILHKVWLLNHI